MASQSQMDDAVVMPVGDENRADLIAQSIIEMEVKDIVAQYTPHEYQSASVPEADSSAVDGASNGAAINEPADHEIPPVCHEEDHSSAAYEEDERNVAHAVDAEACKATSPSDAIDIQMEDGDQPIATFSPPPSCHTEPSTLSPVVLELTEGGLMEELTDEELGILNSFKNLQNVLKACFLHPGADICFRALCSTGTLSKDMSSPNRRRRRDSRIDLYGKILHHKQQAGKKPNTEKNMTCIEFAEGLSGLSERWSSLYDADMLLSLAMLLDEDMKGFITWDNFSDFLDEAHESRIDNVSAPGQPLMDLYHDRVRAVTDTVFTSNEVTNAHQNLMKKIYKLGAMARAQKLTPLAAVFDAKLSGWAAGTAQNQVLADLLKKLIGTVNCLIKEQEAIKRREEEAAKIVVTQSPIRSPNRRRSTQKLSEPSTMEVKDVTKSIGGFDPVRAKFIDRLQAFQIKSCALLATLVDDSNTEASDNYQHATQRLLEDIQEMNKLAMTAHAKARLPNNVNLATAVSRRAPLARSAPVGTVKKTSFTQYAAVAPSGAPSPPTAADIQRPISASQFTSSRNRKKSDTGLNTPSRPNSEGNNASTARPFVTPSSIASGETNYLGRVSASAFLSSAGGGRGRNPQTPVSVIVKHTTPGVIAAKTRNEKQLGLDTTEINRQTALEKKLSFTRVRSACAQPTGQRQRSSSAPRLGIFRSPQSRQEHGNRNVYDEESMSWTPTKVASQFNRRFQSHKDMLFAQKVNRVFYSAS